MVRTCQQMHWLRGQLRPLAATLLPCPVDMPSIHFRQGSVRWVGMAVLMVTRVRLLDTSTKQQMLINQALMAIKAINSSVLMLILPREGFYLSHLALVHRLLMVAMLRACNALVILPLFLSRTSGHPTIFFFLPALCLAMPCKRGKSWHGPAYYSQFGRNKRPGAASLSPSRR